MITDTMLSLYLINSENTGAVFNLDSTPGATYRIGRSRECEIAMPEEMHLSRVHCILTVGDGCALLTDNNSSNGIYEDDVRKPEFLMMPGKQYRAGNCRLMLEYTADEPEEEPAEQRQEEPVAEEPTLSEEPVDELPPTAYEELPAETDQSPPAPAEVSPTTDDTPYSEHVQTAFSAEATETSAEPDTDGVEPTPQAEHTETPLTDIATETPPAAAPEAATRKRFIPAPPRRALVQRPAPRAFYTAAGRLSTDPLPATSKQLKHRTAGPGHKVVRPPSQPATHLGLPNDFKLRVQLLNTTPTLEEGDLLRFSVLADEDCQVYLIQYDSENNAVMLVPGVGGACNKVQADEETPFPPSGNNNKYELYVERPYGRDTIIAVACTMNTPFAKVWAECLKETDDLRKPGDTEEAAIRICQEESGMDDAQWAATVLYIHTGDAR